MPIHTCTEHIVCTHSTDCNHMHVVMVQWPFGSLSDFEDGIGYQAAGVKVQGLKGAMCTSCTIGSSVCTKE